MKKRILVFGIIFAIVMFCNVAICEDEKSEVIAISAEEEKDWGVEFNTDIFSKFVWRGQNLNDDWVMQPSIAVSYKSLSFSVWGTYDFTDYNDQQNEFTELDYTLEYSDALPFEKLEWLNYSVGAIHYSLQGNECPHTTELFWGFGVEEIPLSPSIKVYHDMNVVNKGMYVQFSVEHSFEKVLKLPGAEVGIDIGASVGWGNKKYNQYYWETESGSLNDFTLSLAFPISIEKFDWSLTPSINYVHLIDGQIRESDLYSRGSDIMFVGVSVTKSF